MDRTIDSNTDCMQISEFYECFFFKFTKLLKNHTSEGHKSTNIKLYGPYYRVCCGVRGRALASHTDVRGFELPCGGRLSSLTCLQL